MCNAPGNKPTSFVAYSSQTVNLCIDMYLIHCFNNHMFQNFDLLQCNAYCPSNNQMNRIHKVFKMLRVLASCLPHRVRTTGLVSTVAVVNAGTKLLQQKSVPHIALRALGHFPVVSTVQCKTYVIDICFYSFWNTNLWYGVSLLLKKRAFRCFL